MLRAAIDSCLAQDAGDLSGCEILVVDNSPEGSARSAIEARAGQGPIPIRYLPVPEPGIARARNAGVAAALGQVIVFLDDDQVAASPHWLGAFLILARQGAKAVFGPIQPEFEGGSDGIPAGALRLFRRSLAADDGQDVSRFKAFLGSGNSLFERAGGFVTATPFPSELDGLGGEDSEFIAGLTMRGLALVWANGALARERVPAARKTERSLEQRSFRNGQIRSLVQSRSGCGSAPRVALWMGVGLAQAALHGIGALVLARLWPAASADLRVRAWGGLGKVLWMKRFWHISCPAAV